MRRILVSSVALLLIVSVLNLEPARQAVALSWAVNSAGDTSDANPGDGFCDDGAGNCTLRAAIQEANANTNPVTAHGISFDSPVPNQPINIRVATALPTITQPTFIVGVTASGASCNPVRNLMVSIEPSGALANGSAGLRFETTGAGSGFSALQIGGFPSAGAWFTGGDDVRVLCSNIGTNLAGTAANPNSIGIVMEDVESGWIGYPGVAFHNLISGNGYGVAISDSTLITIRGNRIGLDVTGTAALPNGVHGIDIANSSFVTVGDSDLESRNYISGNTGDGISVYAHAGGTTNGVSITNNVIGRSTGNAPVPNGGHGIQVEALESGTVDRVTVGNDVAGNGHGEPNTIFAGGQRHAVLVRQADAGSTVSRVTIARNVLESESGLAINLRPVGESPATVTPNDFDALDADTGPNTLLNFPEPTLALAGDNPRIEFTYRTSANSNGTLDFFAVDECGPGGNRSLQRWLGSLPYTTFTSGHSGTYEILNSAVAVGEGVHIVATDGDGNTSEISPCITAEEPQPSVGDLTPESAVAGQSGFTITVESPYPFGPDPVIVFDGTQLATTVVDPLTLQAFVTAELIGDTARVVNVGVIGAGFELFAIWRSSSDLNCSNRATAADALLLLQILAGLESVETIDNCDFPPFDPGDANQDGNVDLADALHIRRELAGLIEPLPGDGIAQ